MSLLLELRDLDLLLLLVLDIIELVASETGDLAATDLGPDGLGGRGGEEGIHFLEGDTCRKDRLVYDGVHESLAKRQGE